MFRNTRINTLETNRIIGDIIYLIDIDDYDELVNIIKNKNINKIINNVNGYSILHYAIMRGRDKIIKYLLMNNASPYTRTLDGLDAFDLSLKYNNKTLINYELEKNKNLVSDLNKSILSHEKKINSLEMNNKYLEKANEEYLNKYNLINKNLVIETKDKESLKRKFDDMEEKHENLELKYNKLEKKCNKIEQSYSGLLNNLK